MLKILLIPSFWGNLYSIHWCWTAEMITRYVNKDKFLVDTTLDIALALKNKDRYDLLHPFHTISTQNLFPLEKTLLTSHSIPEAKSMTRARGNSVLCQKVKEKFFSNDEHIKVVPYGIKTEFFSPLPKKKSPKLKFGFVGTWETKGGEFVQHLADRKDIEFVSCMPAHPSFYRKPLFGMPNYYNSIDVLIVPNFPDHEGFARPILEGASCGLPIISTDCGIAKEIIGDNEGGFIIEQKKEAIDKAVDFFVNNPSQVKKMGKRNRELVLSDWTWKKRIKNWENWFEFAYEEGKN